MEKEVKTFELKVIDNKNELVTNPLAKAPNKSNPMMAKFLEFRQARKFAPKDLV